MTPTRAYGPFRAWAPTIGEIPSGGVRVQFAGGIAVRCAFVRRDDPRLQIQRAVHGSGRAAWAARQGRAAPPPSMRQPGSHRSQQRARALLRLQTAGGPLELPVLLHARLPRKGRITALAVQEVTVHAARHRRFWESEEAAEARTAFEVTIFLEI